MKFFFLMSTLFLSSQSFAAFDLPELREVVVSKFLNEANNPRTKLAKRIDQINAENADGRNSEGPITIPVTHDSLQIVLLEAEELYNPWHYAELSEDKKTCNAGGDSATFLIHLDGYLRVHGAGEYETYTFTSTAYESMSAKRKDGGEIEYCDDVLENENDEYIISPIEYTASDFKEVEIKIPEN